MGTRDLATVPIILFLERSCRSCRRLAVELDRAGTAYELHWRNDAHAGSGMCEANYLGQLAEVGYDIADDTGVAMSIAPSG